MEVINQKSYRSNWRFTYLTLFFLKRVFGVRLTLKWTLRAHWILRRISYEVAGSVFGERFQNEALGLSLEFLNDNLKKTDSVADLGCGTGRWTRACAGISAHVIGIDSNHLLIQACKDRGDSIQFLCLDLESNLELMPKVDVVLMVHFLEHISNPLNMLTMLREKATSLIIEVPDFSSDPLNYARLWINEPFVFDMDHKREFTLIELKEMLKQAGWECAQAFQKGGTILMKATKR
jgi:SAM-dependent methyltransferase